MLRLAVTGAGTVAWSAPTVRTLAWPVDGSTGSPTPSPSAPAPSASVSTASPPAELTPTPEASVLGVRETRPAASPAPDALPSRQIRPVLNTTGPAVDVPRALVTAAALLAGGTAATVAGMRLADPTDEPAGDLHGL